MARLFVAASSERIVTVGGPLAGVTSAGTWAAVLRVASSPAATQVVAGVGTTAARMALSTSATGVTGALGVRHGNTQINAPTIRCASSDGWVLVAATKTSGTTTPRFHKYVFSTGVWTHENGASTAADSTALGADAVQLGALTSASFFDGDLDVVALYSGVALSDAQLEAMAASLDAWFQVQPTALWLLDQDTVTQRVLDLSGTGVNEAAGGRTGTAVSTSSAPLAYGHEIIAP